MDTVIHVNKGITESASFFKYSSVLNYGMFKKERACGDGVGSQHKFLKVGEGVTRMWPSGQAVILLINVEGWELGEGGKGVVQNLSIE